ncbi:MAG: hypothetical protein V3S48_02755 [Candidatus Neomarinimicrobiota bacterium]
MENMNFINNLAKTLAWPLAAVIIAVILRRPLTILIPYLRRIKYKKLELEFENNVHFLAEQTARKLTPGEELIPAHETGLKELMELSPRAAIYESWQSVKAVEKNGNPRDLDQFLLKTEQTQGSLKNETRIQVIKEFNKLGNQAKKIIDFPISVRTAREYASTARRLKDKLTQSD